MSNGYFDPTDDSRLGRFTLGRAEAVNALFQGVKEGFDKLPTEAQLKQGLANVAANVGGTANAITLEMTYPISSYTNRMLLRFRGAAANTGATTVNVDGVGVVALKRQDGSDVVAGDIPSGGDVQIVYNSTAGHFRLAGAQAGDVALAQAAASTATTQAGIATSAASTATTQAGIATTKATEASDSALAALGYRNEAQAAVGGARVTGNDTIAGALFDKIEVAGGMAKQVVNPGANETLLLTATAQLGAGGAEASGSVVLTNESPGVQAVTTTGYGQSVTLPDATTLAKGVPHYAISNKGSFDLAIKDHTGTIRGFLSADESTVAALADNEDAAGVWVLPGARLLGVSAALDASGVDYGGGNFLQSVALDASRTLIVMGFANIYARVLDEATGTWGAAALVQSNANSNSLSLLIDTDKVLLTYAIASNIHARVLTISGLDITVSTAASAATSGTVTLASDTDLITCDGSYVLSFSVSAPGQFIVAMTVSGSTVTIGSPVEVLTGSGTSPHLYYASSGVVLAIVSASGTLRCRAYAVSGTSLTAGAQSDLIISTGSIRSLALGTGRWAVLFNPAGGDFAARIISVSGTIVTSSATATLTTVGGISNIHQADAALVSADKVLLVTSNASTIFTCNILTDNAGTAVAGTALTFTSASTMGGNSLAIFAVEGGVATVAHGETNTLTLRQIDVSGGSPAYSGGRHTRTPANLASSVQSSPRGALKPSLLRAGGSVASTLSAVNGDSALVRGGQAAFLPLLPITNTLQWRGRDETESWALQGSGAFRPILIQRVTLAQP